MGLKRIGETLRLHIKRFDASANSEASSMGDLHSARKTKQTDDGDDDSSSGARRIFGKSKRIGGQRGSKRLSLRHALAFGGSDRRAGSRDTMPLCLTDPRYPAAQLAAGLRKYSHVSPPRGTLNDEKIEYLTWRLLAIFVQQSQEDLDEDKEADDAAKESRKDDEEEIHVILADAKDEQERVINVEQSAQTATTKELLVEEERPTSTTEAQQIVPPPTRPHAARHASSSSSTSASSSSSSAVDSTALFTDRDDGASSSSSLSHSSSRSSKVLTSIAMKRCVGNANELHCKDCNIDGTTLQALNARHCSELQTTQNRGTTA